MGFVRTTLLETDSDFDLVMVESKGNSRQEYATLGQISSLREARSPPLL